MRQNADLLNVLEMLRIAATVIAFIVFTLGVIILLQQILSIPVNTKTSLSGWSFVIVKNQLSCMQG